MTQNQMVNLVREYGWIPHDFAKDLEQIDILPPLKFNLKFGELDGDYTADDINFKIIT